MAAAAIARAAERAVCRQGRGGRGCLAACCGMRAPQRPAAAPSLLCLALAASPTLLAGRAGALVRCERGVRRRRSRRHARRSACAAARAPHMRGGTARAHLRAAAAAGSCMVGHLSPVSCIAQPCADRWGRAGFAWCGHAESHVGLALVGLLHQSPTLCQPEGLRLNFSGPVGKRLATC